MKKGKIMAFTKRVEGAYKRLASLRLRSSVAEMTIEDENMGMAATREILRAVIDPDSSLTHEESVFLVVRALSFRAEVARNYGCHKDAHSCDNFRNCYVRAHVLTTASGIPKSVTKAIVEGSKCFSDEVCSLNLDRPGSRGEASPNTSEAMAVHADSCDDTATVRR